MFDAQRSPVDDSGASPSLLPAPTLSEEDISVSTSDILTLCRLFLRGAFNERTIASAVESLCDCPNQTLSKIARTVLSSPLVSDVGLRPLREELVRIFELAGDQVFDSKLRLATNEQLDPALRELRDELGSEVVLRFGVESSEWCHRYVDLLSHALEVAGVNKKITTDPNGSEYLTRELMLGTCSLTLRIVKSAMEQHELFGKTVKGIMPIVTQELTTDLLASAYAKLDIAHDFPVLAAKTAKAVSGINVKLYALPKEFADYHEHFLELRACGSMLWRASEALIHLNALTPVLDSWRGESSHVGSKTFLELPRIESIRHTVGDGLETRTLKFSPSAARLFVEQGTGDSAAVVGWTLHNDGGLTLPSSVRMITALDLVGAQSLESGMRRVAAATGMVHEVWGEVQRLQHLAPLLYSQLEWMHGLKIEVSENAFRVIVPARDGELLKQLVEGNSTAPFCAGILTDESDNSESFFIEFPARVEPGPEQPPVETVPVVEAEPEPPRFDQNLNRHCRKYTDLRAFLAKHWGVEETTHGKGSHHSLVRDGHLAVVSKNLRDGTLVIDPSIVASLCRSLEIPIREFLTALQES